MFTFSPKNVLRTPYPFVVGEVFEPTMYQKLLEDFPKISDKSLSEASFQGGRMRIQSGSEEFENLVRSSPAWTEFNNYARSRALVKYFSDLFGAEFQRNMTNLESMPSRIKLRHKLRNLLGINPFGVDIDLSTSGLGYVNRIHSDRERRHLVMLIFFCDAKEEGMVGGEFVVHELKNYIPTKADRFFDAEQCTVKQKIRPKHNTGVAFLNSPKSLHSVSEIIKITGRRKFVYLGLNF